jgi:hypothetical protein
VGDNTSSRKVYQNMNTEYKQKIEQQIHHCSVDLALASRELRKQKKIKQEMLRNHEAYRKKDLGMMKEGSKRKA